MYFLPYFFEGDIALFPIWHLEGIEEVKDLLDLLIIFLDVVSSNSEIPSHFIEHLSPHLIELYRLIDD